MGGYGMLSAEITGQNFPSTTFQKAISGFRR